MAGSRLGRRSWLLRAPAPLETWGGEDVEEGPTLLIGPEWMWRVLMWKWLFNAIHVIRG